MQTPSRWGRCASRRTKKKTCTREALIAPMSPSGGFQHSDGKNVRSFSGSALLSLRQATHGPQMTSLSAFVRIAKLDWLVTRTSMSVSRWWLVRGSPATRLCRSTGGVLVMMMMMITPSENRVDHTCDRWIKVPGACRLHAWKPRKPAPWAMGVAQTSPLPGASWLRWSFPAECCASR